MNDTKQTFEAALATFMQKLQEMMDVAYKGSSLKPTMQVDPGGKKYLRIVKADSAGGAAYCFIEVETGNILKSGSWAGPEPKKHPRGNIFGENPLAGCGPYGVAYLR